MKSSQPVSRIRSARVILVLLTCVSTLFFGLLDLSAQADQSISVSIPLVTNRSDGTTRVFLPTVRHNYPLRSSFLSFEASPGALGNSKIAQYADALGAKSTRVSAVSWRSVQPNQGQDYDWSSLKVLEQDVLAANRAGLTPMVVVLDSPTWATGTESTCGAIQSGYFDEFAKFMQALVARYKAPPYNVHHWELGNEPDVDPSLVPTNSGFGCWGNKNDPYYGGEQYGRMLNAVTPAIKAVDADAKVIVGGLLLASPETDNQDPGKPEKFFEGILRAAEAQNFDIVAYHVYDIHDGNDPIWDRPEYEGIAKGKPRFLQAIMRQYDVSKPLIANEMAYLWCEARPGRDCPEPTAGFFEAQANAIPRLFSRTLSVGGVENVTWYQLNGPGWRQSTLLDNSQNPRPSYIAYQQFARQVGSSTVPPTQIQDYGESFEAYRFVSAGKVVDVVWSRDAQPRQLSIPQSQFLTAFNRDGQRIVPATGNGNAVLTVGSGAVYIHRTP